jgi:hypothetical protein
MCCDRTFTTFPSFRSHQAAHERRGTKEKMRARPQQKFLRDRRSVIVPDGLGYLKRFVTSPDGLAGYNLSVVSRFAAALNDGRPSKKRFTKGSKMILQAMVKNPIPLNMVKCEVPSAQAIAVYQLALSVNASPGDVGSLLIAYGLEHLALELRAGKSAPPVGIPDVRIKPIQVYRSPHKEFLDANFPEDAPPKEVVEHVEYHKPIVVRSFPQVFPSSEDADEGDV